jgi:DNA-binding MarR family transcriptional regulator/N-acetylglutamate synthase-like GNAT family acetyltransferase
MTAPVRTLPAPNPDDAVQAMRRFNRFYTRQIGVLQEHLLHSQFSLTEVRVLYELAHREGVTAVELREELGLDRGYLSRMLQNFETHRWIKTATSSADRRRILLSLTSKGRKVFNPLDRRSSEEVAAMINRISAAQQDRLFRAMREIQTILNPDESRISTSQEKILTAEIAEESPRTQRKSSPNATYTLRPPRPGDMGWVVQRHGELYWQEYRYDERFEALVAEIVAEFIQNFDPKRERCWIAEKDGERAGAIFLVKKSKTVAKLRLLLVEPWARGLGIGRRLVSECVSFARDAGYKKILLWTQSELHAARHLYEQAGFKRIAQKPHQSWGRKDLVAETWELNL